MVGGGEGAFIGHVHRRAAELDGKVELVAGAFSSDPRKAHASAAAMSLDPARSYASWEQMMASEAALPADRRIDFVAIVTPNHLHFPVAKAAIEAGFHVMCEKPMVRSLDEAEALCELLAERETLFGLCHTYTGYPMIRRARAMVKRGGLGRITRVVVNYTHGNMVGVAADELGRRWRADPERSGISNAMGDIGTHCHNLIGFVTGLRQDRICADLHAVRPGELDNEGTVIVDFEGGAKGLIHVSQLCVGDVNNLWIKVHGEEASIEWKQTEPETLWHRRAGRPASMITRGIGEPVDEEPNAGRLPPGHPEGFIEAFATLYSDFADAILRGAPSASPVPDQYDGLAGISFVHDCILADRSSHKWHAVGRTASGRGFNGEGASMTGQPNILFIMADDHAARAIGAYGSGLNRTPHLDRIADGGMRLDHCYVTNSICTPSRAAILTGTYNHVNGVKTLATPIDANLPNVAKHLQVGGYQTAIVGKWHLGEGPAHAPSGFDFWSVLPGQGEYFDPAMIEMGRRIEVPGYATDIITDKSLDWLKARDRDRPFFLMCHHKAPHRSWEPHPRHKHLYLEEIALPDTFDDDYKNRAKAAAAATMRVRADMAYEDLGLVQPEGGREVGRRKAPGATTRIIPFPEDVGDMRLIDRETGEAFTFDDREQLARFKYQRYLRRYLQTITAIDDSAGRLLDYLDENGIADDTLVIYTSDQGFFLGEHGWFDKRFMYEESFQMPFLARFPALIKAGTVSDRIACNVDFAPTFLDLAGLTVPSYMQGRSLRPVLVDDVPADWQQVAYHRYWMHRDAEHNAYAHYGVRDQRYKLIYWYNEGMGLPGTNAGGEAKEWELFDCEADPLELFNVYADPAYAMVVSKMVEKLDAKMAEIGDLPVH